MKDQCDFVAEESKFIIFKQDDIYNECLPLMKEIRRQGKLCDVTIKVDDQVFSAHRIVLAGAIPYFYAMFTSNMTESRIKEITMKDIDSCALETLINYAYSGQVRIDNQNVQTIMLASSFLQLLKVREACADFLISCFHPHNVLGIRNFGDTLSCTHLIAAADKYINANFEAVSQSEEFLNLEHEELSEIIRRDELKVKNEEITFDACLKWVKYAEEKRARVFALVLAQVRLPLLSPEFLIDHVAREGLIRSSLPCRDLVDEAKDYHLLPERRGLLQSHRTRPRTTNWIMGYIYAVGGLASNGESVSTVEIYDPFKKTWCMGKQMSMMRSRVGVSVMGGKVYAFGGFNGTERLSTVEVYDPKTNNWTQGRPMNCKRSAVAVAASDDHIYVCGGYDGVTSLNIVECYCPKTEIWKTLAPMMKYRSAGGVTYLNGYVYALGGHDGLSIFDSVERYDPVTDTWLKLKSMLNRRCRLGVVGLNDKLYACGGYDGTQFLNTVELYDPEHDSWSTVASMNCKRSRVALISNMGKLWALGGYDGETNLSTMEVYDPETNEWSFAPSMCAHSGGVGAGVI